MLISVMNLYSSVCMLKYGTSLFRIALFQVLSSDAEPKRKLKDIVMKATR